MDPCHAALQRGEVVERGLECVCLFHRLGWDQATPRQSCDLAASATPPRPSSELR